ncbi:MAG: hypothetical protein CBC65_001835 [Rhodothermaceae bacterium TMED105]|nr:MAG: hypothetical protein CBC65_001835 [Rhodothermaceae bacterium TMED105]
MDKITKSKKSHAAKLLLVSLAKIHYAYRTKSHDITKEGYECAKRNTGEEPMAISTLIEIPYMTYAKETNKAEELATLKKWLIETVKGILEVEDLELDPRVMKVVDHLLSDKAGRLTDLRRIRTELLAPDSLANDQEIRAMVEMFLKQGFRGVGNGSTWFSYRGGASTHRW